MTLPYKGIVDCHSVDCNLFQKKGLTFWRGYAKMHR